MRAFINTTYDLLNAEMGAGNKLAGIVTLSKNPTLRHQADGFPLILISYPKDLPLANRTQGYKVFQAQVGIWVAIKYSDKDQDYEAAEISAEDYGDKVQDILLTDTKLVTATYPSGLSYREESTKFGEIVTGPDVIDGNKVAVTRLPFMTEVLKRFTNIVQQ
jgi:hypothetical protein